MLYRPLPVPVVCSVYFVFYSTLVERTPGRSSFPRSPSPASLLRCVAQFHPGGYSRWRAGGESLLSEPACFTWLFRWQTDGSSVCLSFLDLIGSSQPGIFPLSIVGCLIGWKTILTYLLSDVPVSPFLSPRVRLSRLLQTLVFLAPGSQGCFWVIPS